MINIVKSALTHFGRKAVVERHAAGESYSDIQVDALTQRDETIVRLGTAIDGAIPSVNGYSATETGFCVTVRNTLDKGDTLDKLNAILETHGQLFFARDCRFIKQHRFADVTTYALQYNLDHS